MAQFVKEGKVKYLGVSEVSAKSLRRAHAVHPVSTVQLEYSASDLGIESEEIGVLKVARELGIAVVAYSPLGRGLLIGQVRKHEDFPANDFRRMFPRYNPEYFPNYLQLADALSDIGKAHKLTAGRSPSHGCSSKAKTLSPSLYLDESFGALKVTLSKEEVAKIRELAEKADSGFTGARYPPFLEVVAYGDTPELS